MEENFSFSENNFYNELKDVFPQNNNESEKEDEPNLNNLYFKEDQNEIMKPETISENKNKEEEYTKDKNNQKQKNKKPIFIVKKERKTKIQIKIKNNEKSKEFIKENSEKTESSKKSSFELNKEENTEIKKELNENNNFSKENENIVLNDDNTNNNKNNILPEKRKRKKKIPYKNKKEDKLVKNVRTFILKLLFKSINKKIQKEYNHHKKFLRIGSEKLSHSSVEYDKDFLNLRIKDILSSKISRKYNYFNKDNNIKLIEELTRPENKEKKFEELFNLTFIEYLTIVRKLNNFNEVLKEELKESTEEEFILFKECVDNYESIVGEKKSKKKNLKIDN